MASPVFDTLKAAKTLVAAGFNEAQAEAVVATVGGAVEEGLVTKPHLERLLQPLMTRADLKKALEPMVTKAELASALKSALEPMVSREHLQQELMLLQQRVTIRLGGLMVAGIGALAVLNGLL